MNNQQIECFDKLVYFLGIPSGVLVTLLRSTGVNSHSWIEIVLGSYPSFIFVLGGAVIIKRLRDRLTCKTLATFASGAITYEWSQRYANGAFDVSDCIAIGIASLIMCGLLHVGYGKSTHDIDEKALNVNSN